MGWDCMACLQENTTNKRQSVSSVVVCIRHDFTYPSVDSLYQLLYVPYQN